MKCLKNIFDYLSYLVIKIIISIFQFIPTEKRKYLFNFLANISFYIFRIKRKTVLKNISVIKPGISYAQKRRIARESYFHSLRMFSDFFCRDYDIGFIKISNEKVFNQALAKGKQVMVLTAHIGNWEMLGRYLVVKGLKLAVVFQSVHSVYLNDFLINMRHKISPKLVNRRDTKSLLESARDGYSFGVLIDQKPVGKKTYMKFFGIETPFYQSIINLAIKYKLTILPAFSFYEGDLLNICFEKPIQSNDHIEILREYISHLEKYIRRYPSQWFLFHNRWK